MYFGLFCHIRNRIVIHIHRCYLSPGLSLGSRKVIICKTNGCCIVWPRVKSGCKECIVGAYIVGASMGMVGAYCGCMVGMVSAYCRRKECMVGAYCRCMVGMVSARVRIFLGGPQLAHLPTNPVDWAHTGGGGSCTSGHWDTSCATGTVVASGTGTFTGGGSCSGYFY